MTCRKAADVCSGLDSNLFVFWSVYYMSPRCDQDTNLSLLPAAATRWQHLHCFCADTVGYVHAGTFMYVHVWMYSGPIAPFTAILYFRLPSQHPSPVLIIHCQWMRAWWERESQYLRSPVFAWNHSKHVLLSKNVASLLTWQHVFSLTIQGQQITEPPGIPRQVTANWLLFHLKRRSMFLASDKPDVCNAGEYSRFVFHHIYKLPPAVLVTSTI